MNVPIDNQLTECLRVHMYQCFIQKCMTVWQYICMYMYVYISIYNIEARDNIRCIWNHYVRGLEVPALQYCRSHREPPLNTSERERQWLPETMQEHICESAAMESLHHSTLPSTSTQLPPLPPATATNTSGLPLPNEMPQPGKLWRHQDSGSK